MKTEQEQKMIAAIDALTKDNKDSLNDFLKSFNRNSLFDIEVVRLQISKLKNEKDVVSQFSLQARKTAKSIKKFKELDSSQVITEKHIRKTIEASDEAKRDYSQFIIALNDAHHFTTVMLRILYVFDIRLQHGTDMEMDIYDTPDGFTEIVNATLMDKDTKEALLTFNRFRNVLSHSSTLLAINYLSSNILISISYTALVVYYEILRMLNNMSFRDNDLLMDILKDKSYKNADEKNLFLKPLAKFAETCEPTSKEIIEIAQSLPQFSDIKVHLDTQLDILAQKRILEIIDERKQKEEAARLEREKIEQFKNRKAIRTSLKPTLVINTKRLLKRTKQNEDQFVNAIHQLIDETCASRVILLNDTSANTLKLNYNKILVEFKIDMKVIDIKEANQNYHNNSESYFYYEDIKNIINYNTETLNKITLLAHYNDIEAIKTEKLTVGYISINNHFIEQLSA